MMLQVKSSILAAALLARNGFTVSEALKQIRQRRPRCVQFTREDNGPFEPTLVTVERLCEKKFTESDEHLRWINTISCMPSYQLTHDNGYDTKAYSEADSSEESESGSSTATGPRT